MNIYLFTKEKFKLIKATIHLGDFCLLYDNEALYLWIQDEHSLKEETDLGINYTQVCSNVKIICPANPLIFSYNGVEKRTGNRKDLKVLIDSISNQQLQDVLKNALDILEYREDRIDIIPLSLLFERIQEQLMPIPHTSIKKENKDFAKNAVKEKTQSTKVQIKKIKESATKTNEPKEIYPPQAYYFYDYLGVNEQKYWQTHYLDNNTSTHIIYKNIRKIFKIRYSEAFENFLRDNPELNIYSRKEDVSPIMATPKPEEEIIDPVQSLYLLLDKNGYVQFDNEKWKTPDGQCLNILIKEIVNEPSKNEFKKTDTAIQEVENDGKGNKLKGIFKHVSSTYKFFWFLSILTISKRKKSRKISYKELTARMISLAYPYTENRISFGNIDKLHDIIQSLVLTETFNPYKTIAKNEKEIIKQFDDERVHRILNQLLLNVPYRFLSPWIPFTNNKAVIAQSQDSEKNVPYAIHPTHIILNKDWYNYLIDNYETLFKYAKSELSNYLLHFNDELHIKRLNF